MGLENHHSKLDQHKLFKKTGLVVSPMNHAMGDALQLTSWQTDRLPEYLWLGLIFSTKKRIEGIDTVGRMLLDISKAEPSLSFPMLSQILELSPERQSAIFDIICKYAGKDVLSSLTVVLKNQHHPIFNKYFYDRSHTIQQRIARINAALITFAPHQSNAATDLRFLSLSLLRFNDRIRITASATETINALREYHYTDHDDEKMRAYRPLIRSMEGAHSQFQAKNAAYIKEFWRTLNALTNCEPHFIKMNENTNDYESLIIGAQKVLEYLVAQNKAEPVALDKFEVIIGSINFQIKIFSDVCRNNLGNSILGRHASRTIIEIFIMLKYLQKLESQKNQIWTDYKSYGISKYKLVLLKAREKQEDKEAQLCIPVIDLIVNEVKSEEFIDIDLKYFDKLGIREKSIEVGEKDLYDLYYDYDSSYAHGLWGAIRESSFMFCNTPSHLGHIVPDIQANQSLPDVKSDCAAILNRTLQFLNEVYPIPAELLNFQK